MIGLDFGTTNTCGAFGDYRGEVTTIPLTPDNVPPYDAIMPSAVLNPLADAPTIGIAAQTSYRALPDAEKTDAVYLNSFKLHLDDYRLKERRRVVDRESFVYHPHEQIDVLTPTYRYEWTTGEYTRGQLVGAVAALVSRVVRNARDQGADPEQIMLGIPVAFSSRARKRMICALYRTGLFASYRDLLEHVRFVLEPLAAAAAGMREAFDADDREVVLVFDHGGGTLDLSLVEFERREGFDYPIPVRELQGQGAPHVAGGRFDEAFARELAEDATIRRLMAQMDRWDVSQFVKAAKEDLSTSTEADLNLGEAIFPVSRETLDRAAAPILGHIEQEIARLLHRAEVGIGDVDRVLLTGGCSLVPCVQRRVADIFADLAKRDRVRAYDPTDSGDTERAMTEVAQGLVHIASDEAIERVVLWDVDLVTSEGGGFIPVARRGDRYQIDSLGRPELCRTLRITDRNANGMAIGLFEAQLDRLYFLFGLADIPPTNGPLSIEVCLRPDALYPVLRVIDANGEELTRDWHLTGWETDAAVTADMNLLEEGQLEDFFEHDHVEYLPDTPFTKFTYAPLTRPLRIGDRIEWVDYIQDQSLGSGRRHSGEVISIRRVGEVEPLQEMDSPQPELFDLNIRGDEPGATWRLNSWPYGCVRVATRPVQ